MTGGLATEPDLDAFSVVFYPRYRIERLELPVIHEIGFVFGLVLFRRAAERRVYIAMFMNCDSALR